MPETLAASAYVLQNGRIIAALNQNEDALMLVEGLEKLYPPQYWIKFTIQYVDIERPARLEIWKKRD